MVRPVLFCPGQGQPRKTGQQVRRSGRWNGNTGLNVPPFLFLLQNGWLAGWLDGHR